MDIEIFTQRARAWARRQPRAVLIPVAFIAIVVFLTIVSMARRGLSRTVPEHSPAAMEVPNKNLPPATVIKPPETSQAVAAHLSKTGVGIASTPVPAGTALGVPSHVPMGLAQAPAPPVGIAPGWVESITYQRDQFGQLAQVEALAEPAQLTSFQSENPARGGSDWAQKFQGWFKLDAPMTISILRVAAGAGTVTATIDGQSLGQPLSLTEEPVSRAATLNLGAGWHTFLVQVSRGGFQRADAGIAVQIAVGDGTTPPAPVVPYALPTAAGSAASLPADVQSAAPAKQSMGGSPVAGARPGFTPDFTDTYKRAARGPEECSCRSEESSVRSSSAVRLNRPGSRVSLAPKWPASWGSGRTC
ncbi:MAG: hypothetical protein RSP_20920 [Rhodanobacter sp.]